MTLEQNKALIRRFYEEVWNKGNLDVAEAVFAADYVRHDLRPGHPPSGPEGQKRIAADFRAAFPDLQMTIDLMVAEEVVRMPPHEFELFRASPAWPARVAAAHTLPRELRAHEHYRFKAGDNSITRGRGQTVILS